MACCSTGSNNKHAEGCTRLTNGEYMYQTCMHMTHWDACAAHMQCLRPAVHNISRQYLNCRMLYQTILPGDGSYTSGAHPCDHLQSARLEASLDPGGPELRQGCLRQPLVSWGRVQLGRRRRGCSEHESGVWALNQDAICLHDRTDYNWLRSYTEHCQGVETAATITAKELAELTDCLITLSQGPQLNTLGALQ